MWKKIFSFHRASALMKNWSGYDRLEVDLLLGSWASENVMSLTQEELTQYEDILNQETIDIFNLLSGKDPIPEVRGSFTLFVA